MQVTRLSLTQSLQQHDSAESMTPKHLSWEKVLVVHELWKSILRAFRKTPSKTRDGPLDWKTSTLKFGSARPLSPEQHLKV